jgi:hypothetical protein
MSQQLKAFGLKYIEEMAKEREFSKKEVSIGILNLQNSQLQNIKRELTFQDFEDFVEGARNTVIRIFDGEFTKLTIKSLTKMRQLLTGTLPADYSLEDNQTSKFDFEKLSRDMNLQSELYEILKKEKIRVETDLNLKNEELLKFNKELEEKLDTLTLNEKKLYVQNQSLDEQLASLKDQVSNLSRDVQLKNRTLELLVEQNKLKEEDLQMISESLDGMFKSTEDQHKLELEAVADRTRKELSFEYELTLQDLQYKLEKEKQSSLESEQKYKDLEANHKDYVEKTVMLKKDYAELKFRIDRGSKTLNFIQTLLSTHPLYSSIMILADLGGSLPLDKLAKSVGAAPLRLRHLLTELAERGLIEIGEGDNPQVTILEDY